MKTLLLAGLIVFIIIIAVVVAVVVSGFNFGEFIAKSIADVIGGFLKALFVDWWWP